MTSAVIVINYECPQYLKPQIKRISRHIAPNDVYVYDTSRDLSKAIEIKRIAEEFGIRYVRCRVHDMDNSISHATALNLSYADLSNQYDILIYLDHDCFPFAFFPWREIMATNTFATVPQHDQYPHPGYCFINTKKAGPLNWLPCEGKDTGGRIELHDCYRFTFHYEPEPEHEIVGGFLMHYVKGSGWHKPDEREHLRRIAALDAIRDSL